MRGKKKAKGVVRLGGILALGGAPREMDVLRMMDTLGTFFSGVTCEVQVRKSLRYKDAPSSAGLSGTTYAVARQEDGQIGTIRRRVKKCLFANGWEGFRKKCRMRLGSILLATFLSLRIHV